MSLHQHLKQHPELGLCTIIMLLLGVLGAALVLHFAGLQQAAYTEQYGQALADRGAAQAVEPALAQDMISLQVIVQSLAEQPAVLRANIHDVENRLLVESGTSTAPRGYQQPHFNAPITLDTHFVGHLTITLQEPPVISQYRLFLWLWAAAVLTAIIALWLLYALWLRHTGQQPRFTAALSAEQEVAPAQTTNPDTPQHAVVIELVFLNLQTLQQQLSHTGFQERLQCFDHNLSGILALYTGRKQPLRGHRMQLQVTGDTLADASFYALCICQLALRLSLNGPSPPLKLAANVLSTLDEDAPNSLLASYQQPLQMPPEHQTPAVWVDPALQCEQLAEHVQISSDNQLEHIKPPYESLLQRQEQQLTQLAQARAVTSTS
ncbi:hypothetical protein [Gilvimarinus polysaccharolyticus]|uniref:hypothetical protein n=1 Tax=Gilvimarinus polysaccharolyticus TaxID=863921 RepID=UPI0006732F7A|nr:hypothetical protein [Gilvimarinus polysaccharolyticus]